MCTSVVNKSKYKRLNQGITRCNAGCDVCSRAVSSYRLPCPPDCIKGQIQIIDESCQTQMEKNWTKFVSIFSIKILKVKQNKRKVMRIRGELAEVLNNPSVRLISFRPKLASQWAKFYPTLTKINQQNDNFGCRS